MSHFVAVSCLVTKYALDRLVHNADMSKYTLRQLAIAIIGLVLLASASVTVHAATEEPVHAYTTIGSGVKVGFGYALLLFGAFGVLTFLSRAITDLKRR